MSKGNPLLGMGRGKLGDIVLSRAYGEQIARARAKVVKNPRTTGQQVQRIILATVTKAYSQMKPIVNHSWQGVSYGGASMNKFNKLNMDFLRAQLGAYGLDNFDDDPNHQAWFITQGNMLAVPNRWRNSAALDQHQYSRRRPRGRAQHCPLPLRSRTTRNAYLPRTC